MFAGLALSVPTLTAILNTGGHRVAIKAGPTYMYEVSGPFTWRFFRWQIFGHNDVITDFGLTLHRTLDMDAGTASTMGRLINVTNPTLFHVFLLFVLAALIARKWGAAVRKN